MRPKRGTAGYGHLQLRAARLVADDQLTDVEIARDCGIGKATLERWKRSREFAARVVRFRETMAEREIDKGIAARARRVAKLDHRHQKIEQVIEERAADASMHHVPGGASGLVVRTYKQLGLGRNAQQVEEYAVDTGTLRELREIEKQAAIELGQWTEKRELAGQGGGPIMVIEVAEPRTPQPAEGETDDPGA